MAKPLKILLGIIGALLLLVIAAVIALPLLFDPNDYRSKLAEEVKRETGRDFSVGDIRLAVFPWLRVELNDVKLGNAPGFGAAPMLAARHAEVGVLLLPLLREKRVEASTITLEKAQLHLSVDAEGHSNWQDLIKPTDPADTEPPIVERLRKLDISGIALAEVSLLYDNRLSGQKIEIEALKLKTGRLYQGKPFEVETAFKALMTLPPGDGAVASSTQATIAFTSEVTLAANGDVLLSRPKLELDGQQTAASTLAAKLAVQGESLRYTAASQVLSTSPLTVELKKASIGSSGKPPLTAKGKLVASLDYQLASGDALLGKLQLKLEAAQNGAQALSTAFELASDSLAYTKAAQSFTAQPLTLQLQSLVVGAADKPRLTAKGGISTQLVSDFGKQLHTFKSMVADLQLGGSALPGGKPQVFKLSSGITADLAAQQASFSNPQLTGLGLQFAGQKWLLSKLDSAPVLEGDVAVAPFEPRTLLTLLGIAIPQTADADTLKSMSLSAQVSASTKSAKLKGLLLKLDDTTLRGDLAVRDFASSAMSFALMADRLDADRYLPPAPKPGASVGADATVAAKADANATELPIELVDALNAQGTLEIASLKLRNIKLANVRLKLDGARGATHRQQLAANLYGGSADVALSVAPGARHTLKLALTGINAAPLLKDLINSDKLSGKGSVMLDVTSTGRSVGAVKKALDGKLAFNLADGAVKGFNLGQIMRDGQALLSQQMPVDSSAQSTDFAELRGSGVITDGVLKSDDLTAKNPLLRLEGAGEVNLVNETINYLAKPTLVNTAGGQGGKELAGLSGITVPVRISGNLYTPKVGIDWQSAIKQQAVTELRERLGVSEEIVREKREELRAKAKEEISKGLLKLFGGKQAPLPAEPVPADPAPQGP